MQWTGGGSTTSNNNFSPANQWRLFFNGNTSYTITGNEIRLFDYVAASGGIMSRASGNQLIQAPVRFSDSGSRPAFIVTRMGGSGSGGGGGSLTLTDIEIAGNVTQLRFGTEPGAGQISVNGVLSGPGKPLVIGRDHNNDVQSTIFVNLSGNNTFSGGITFRAGTLRAGHNNALGTGKLTIDPEGSSVRTLASTSGTSRTLSNDIDIFNALTLGQTSGGTGSLNLSGNIFLGNEVSSTRTLTVNGAHTLSGNVSGNRGIIKEGSGSLTFEGTHSYTGTTTVNSGSIFVNGYLAGGMVIASGGTLGGSGTIEGSTTVQNGALLSPGNSTGLLTFNNDLSLAGATLMEIDGTVRGTEYDAIDVGGTLSFGGSLELAVSTLYDPGTYTFELFNADTIGAGNFSSIVLTSAYTGSFTYDDADAWIFVGENNDTWTFNLTSGDLSLHVVPEPGLFGLVAGLLAIGVTLRLRRRVN